ncbi:MAG TPA: LysR substrate-binding domain-containing protein [Aestuariivirga sp.]|nr:LysR substrate-binding domain-containing protein [Aestuariivirga sp.]
MVRRHYDLPSLNALAAFEAAARHLSLTRAAAELNVTPGAVSKQVKLLEEEIARPLFIRLHRALQLTAAGETVYRTLRETFERIAASWHGVRSDNAIRTVSIGTTAAFAQLWLMPRLGSFWNAHQDIVIDHMISDRLQDLQRPDVDLRIRYGGSKWPGEEASKLFDDAIVAVASPAFLARHKINLIKEIAGFPLLSVEGVDWTWTTWADFLREFGIARKKLNVRRFNSYVIALQAAQDGQGVALGWLSLVRPLLAKRSLKQVTRAQIIAPGAFYVTWSSERQLSPEAATLRDWLLTYTA